MKTANIIFKICIGISAVILSVAAFNLTIRPAHAAPASPVALTDETSSGHGKYTISYAAAPADGGKTRWSAILLNTETGNGYVYFQESTVKPYFSISGSDAR